MSKVQAIESELRKLSVVEKRRVRQSLDRMLSAAANGGILSVQRQAGLRSQVAAGINQARSGKLAPFDVGAISRIKAKGRKLLAPG